MKRVLIENKHGRIIDWSIGMDGFRTACLYARQFRSSGKAKILPNPEGNGWIIWSILGRGIIATVKPL